MIIQANVLASLLYFLLGKEGQACPRLPVRALQEGDGVRGEPQDHHEPDTGARPLALRLGRLRGRRGRLAPRVADQLRPQLLQHAVRVRRGDRGPRLGAGAACQERGLPGEGRVEAPALRKFRLLTYAAALHQSTRYASQSPFYSLLLLAPTLFSYSYRNLLDLFRFQFLAVAFSLLCLLNVVVYFHCVGIGPICSTVMLYLRQMIESKISLIF